MGKKGGKKIKNDVKAEQKRLKMEKAEAAVRKKLADQLAEDMEHLQMMKAEAEMRQKLVDQLAAKQAEHMKRVLSRIEQLEEEVSPVLSLGSSP